MAEERLQVFGDALKFGDASSLSMSQVWGCLKFGGAFKFGGVLKFGDAAGLVTPQVWWFLKFASPRARRQLKLGDVSSLVMLSSW